MPTLFSSLVLIIGKVFDVACEKAIDSGIGFVADAAYWLLKGRQERTKAAKKRVEESAQRVRQELKKAKFLLQHMRAETVNNHFYLEELNNRLQDPDSAPVELMFAADQQRQRSDSAYQSFRQSGLLDEYVHDLIVTNIVAAYLDLAELSSTVRQASKAAEYYLKDDRKDEVARRINKVKSEVERNSHALRELRTLLDELCTELTLYLETERRTEAAGTYRIGEGVAARRMREAAHLIQSKRD